MRILTYNILDAGLGRIDPLAEAIRLADPDVIILQETTDPEQFLKLADRLHMDHFLAENPRNKDAATALLTRWQIVEVINHAPLDPRLTRSAFHAILRGPQQQELGVVGLHLHPRETLADEDIRLSELPAIIQIAQKLQGRPHVIAGDFNASHPSQIIDLEKLRPATRQRIAQQNNQIPRAVIRRLLEHGYQDAHSLHHAPADFQTSFTTSHPAMRVDFIFISPDLAPHVKSCNVFKPEIARYASDHYPVLAELNL